MRTPLQMEAWWLVRALQAGATVRNISSESSVIAPGPHLLRNSIADFCTRFGLTPRQRAIFALLVEGLAPKEIADRLSISNVTIRRHAEDIDRKCAMRRQREPRSPPRRRTARRTRHRPIRTGPARSGRRSRPAAA